MKKLFFILSFVFVSVICSAQNIPLKKDNHILVVDEELVEVTIDYCSTIYGTWRYKANTTTFTSNGAMMNTYCYLTSQVTTFALEPTVLLAPEIAYYGCDTPCDRDSYNVSNPTNSILRHEYSIPDTNIWYSGVGEVTALEYPSMDIEGCRVHGKLTLKYFLTSKIEEDTPQVDTGYYPKQKNIIHIKGVEILEKVSQSSDEGYVWHIKNEQESVDFIVSTEANFLDVNREEYASGVWQITCERGGFITQPLEVKLGESNLIVLKSSERSDLLKKPLSTE
ncbi:DUF6705 family protein [Limibacter armeniacum]|uniref:DUF6705 family protein n=1 Tax=Limibacter armeniacum TaxID=466084 RepID=UPI002FE594C0